jgi:PIN domain nuclease of toxin-antitoxin system
VDLLLDTHVLLWLLRGDARAVVPLEPLLADRGATVTVSTASYLEIAIKNSVGKLDASVGAVRHAVRDAGLLELSIGGAHAQTLQTLPLHHRDPFDRLLVAQAIAEELTLVTADPALVPYGVELLRV